MGPTRTNVLRRQSFAVSMSEGSDFLRPGSIVLFKAAR